AVQGKFDDVCMLTLKNPLYWRQGGLHYTLDGTEPTEQSPVYTKPIPLYRATTVKAKSILSASQASETVDCNVPVNDVTPPSVKSVLAFSVAPMISLTFSEPLDPASAETITNYTWKAPGGAIESAKLGDDGTSVALKLSAPLSSDSESELSVHGVKDRSPEGNAMGEQSVRFVAQMPVYRQSAETISSTDVPSNNLPVHARDSS